MIRSMKKVGGFLNRLSRYGSRWHQNQSEPESESPTMWRIVSDISQFPDCPSETACGNSAQTDMNGMVRLSIWSLSFRVSKTESAFMLILSQKCYHPSKLNAPLIWGCGVWKVTTQVDCNDLQTVSNNRWWGRGVQR